MLLYPYNLCQAPGRKWRCPTKHLLRDRNKGHAVVSRLLAEGTLVERRQVAKLLDTHWEAWCKKKAMKALLVALAPAIRQAAEAHPEEADFAELAERLLRRCG
jgi:hypothetical protein